MADDDVADLRRILGAALHGSRLVDVPAAVSELPDTCRRRTCAARCPALVAVVLESLVERPEERVLLAGTANLTRSTPRLPAHPAARCSRRWRSRWCCCGCWARGEPDTVTVRIGAENDVEGLQTTSVVSADYGFGGVGVLGPTRMDYPANMAAVRAVARYVGELLGP